MQQPARILYGYCTSRYSSTGFSGPREGFKDELPSTAGSSLIFECLSGPPAGAGEVIIPVRGHSWGVRLNFKERGWICAVEFLLECRSSSKLRIVGGRDSGKQVLPEIRTPDHWRCQYLAWFPPPGEFGGFPAFHRALGYRKNSDT